MTTVNASAVNTQSPSLESAPSAAAHGLRSVASGPITAKASLEHTQKAASSSSSSNGSGSKMQNIIQAHTEALAQNSPLQRQVPASGRVWFTVDNLRIQQLQNLIHYECYSYSTFAQAKEVFDKLANASLKLGIFHFNTVSYHVIHSKSKTKNLKNLAQCKIATNCVITAAKLAAIKESVGHVTHLHLENVVGDALPHLASFSALESLTIDNNAIRLALQEQVLAVPAAKDWKVIDDKALAALANCPKLKELVLKEVEGISIDALRALRSKKRIEVKITLPAECPQPVGNLSCAADIYYKTVRYQSNAGDFTVGNTYTQTYDEGLEFLKVNHLVYSSIFLHIKSPHVSDTFPLPSRGQGSPLSVPPQIPDLSACRCFSYQTEGLMHDERIVQAWVKALQTAKDLREVRLYNVTSLALRHFQALLQVTTLVVNNTGFEKAKSISTALHDGEKLNEKALLPPDDDVVMDFQEKARNLQHMWLLGCPLVTKAAQDYINGEQGLKLHIDEVPSDGGKKRDVVEIE